MTTLPEKPGTDQAVDPELESMTFFELKHYAYSVTSRVKLLESVLSRLQKECADQKLKYTLQQKKVYQSLHQREDRLKSSLVASQNEVKSLQDIRLMLETNAEQMRKLLVEAHEQLRNVLRSSDLYKSQVEALKKELALTQQELCDMYLLNDELNDQNTIVRNQLDQELHRQRQLEKQFILQHTKEQMSTPIN